MTNSILVHDDHALAVYIVTVEQPNYPKERMVFVSAIDTPVHDIAHQALDLYATQYPERAPAEGEDDAVPMEMEQVALYGLELPVIAAEYDRRMLQATRKVRKVPDHLH